MISRDGQPTADEHDGGAIPLTRDGLPVKVTAVTSRPRISVARGYVAVYFAADLGAGLLPVLPAVELVLS